MKLLIAGTRDIRSVDWWSGTPYYMSKALEKRFDVSYVANLFPPTNMWQNFLRRWYWRTGQGWYSELMQKRVFDICARKVEVAIKKEKPDAVLAIHFHPVSELQTDVPVYFSHDATFRLLINTYSDYTNLTSGTLASGERFQAQALERCTMALYSSQWAARSARDHYGAPEAKIRVTPYGANLDEPPSEEEVERLLEKKLKDPTVHFLFVGVDWKRKGGGVAVEMIRQLTARGVRAILNIVGCTPPDDVKALPYIVCHGFLSKKKPEQAALLQSLLANSRFFLMPSEMDCSPCAFCEANAYGIPVISRDVGGISEIVRRDVSGFLLQKGEVEEGVLESVLKLCSDTDSYRKMAQRARYEFVRRLNWDAHTNQVERIICGKSS
jgi:glycosyltransferase involved in cell wall biosynthesis